MLSIQSPALAVALETLFPGEPAAVELKNGLTPADLKAAFRRQALRCHPDRAIALGRSSKELEKEFIAVTGAYNILAQFMVGRAAADRIEAPADSNAGAHHTVADRHWAQPIPANVLKLGQFLFYSGRISWRTLIESLTWQRVQRPLFGQIILAWGYATPRDIRELLTYRHAHEPIGDAAVRMGVLTPKARDAVVGRQRGLQRRLGEYFVEKGILTQRELQELLLGQRLHNRRIEAARSTHRRAKV